MKLITELNKITPSNTYCGQLGMQGGVMLKLAGTSFQAAAKGLAIAVSVLSLAACATPGDGAQPADSEWREVAGTKPLAADSPVVDNSAVASSNATDSAATTDADTSPPLAATPAQNILPAATQTPSVEAPPLKDGQIQPIREMASASIELEQPPVQPGAAQPVRKTQTAKVQLEAGQPSTSGTKTPSGDTNQLTEVVAVDKASAEAGVKVVEQKQTDPAPVDTEAVVTTKELPAVAMNGQADVAKKPQKNSANPVCSEEIDGLAVGEDGCAILDGTVAGIDFGPDSAKLTDDARVLLDSVATVMEKKQNLRLSIATYSQDLDDSALGQLQARRRTLSVIRYLISNGIESARVRPHSSPLPDEFAPGDASTNLLVLQTVAE